MAQLSRLPDTFRWPAVALAIAIAFILGGGLFAANRVEDSIEGLVTATTAARLQASSAQALYLALQETEASERAYLLTGDQHFLDLYSASARQVDAVLEGLKSRARGVAWLQADMEPLGAAVQTRATQLLATVQAAQREGRTNSISSVESDISLRALDNLRAMTSRIAERAEADRAGRAAKLNQRQSLVTEILVLSLVGGVVMIGAVAFGLLWNLDQLRQAREGELRQAAQVAAAIENIRDGVAVFDADGRLTLANARLAPALAVPPARTAPGTNFRALAQQVDLDPPLTGDRPPSTPQTFEARQGNRTLEIWRGPMPGGGQMLAVADLTRRVAAEEVARQAQKMDVLGQMTGGVAHDFNNLLQVVSANLDLVRQFVERGRSSSHELLDRLDAAAAGVTRGARLTRHLLAFARRQPLAPVPLDAGRLLLGMEDTIRRTIGESVTLELIIGNDLWWMLADPVQFENAILNLALNARDAMTGEDDVPMGRLTIEAINSSLDPAAAAPVPDLAPGQYVMFAVTDTGTGMTQDQIARAVEPFYTTKPEGRGTGLGLPMVLGFARQSGGHLQFDSQPGRGTTARLYIPQTGAAPALETPEPQAVPRGTGELVMLVEDDAQVRHAARGALTSLGYKVIEAPSGDAALGLLRGGCRPRVLFTDVVMPGATSVRSLVVQAKELVPGLAVLLTSGYAPDKNGQIDPDVALIGKPWLTDDLARALRAATSAVAPRPTGQRRVLLVEDEDAIRTITADELTGIGFDVLQASTRSSAMARLHPPPDLLITDLGLPDGDGLHLVSEARRKRPDLPIIVMSGRSEPPDRDVVWLPKPYDGAMLRRAVAEAGF